jgi:galactokinase
MTSDSAPPPHALAQRFRQALERRGAGGGLEEAARLTRGLFAEAFAAEPTADAVVWTYAPLIAEHTHYFPGFALLARLPGAVAVASRPAGGGPRFAAAGPSGALLERLDAALQARLPVPEGEGYSVEVALLAGEGPGGAEALLGAAAAALLSVRAPQVSAEVGVGIAAEAVQEVLGRPYGPAYVLASTLAEPLALVDCATYEAIPIDTPEGVGFGLLELGTQSVPLSAVFWERAALVESALERLRQSGTQGLASLRRLEHRDLPAALDQLGAAERPFIRHLVSEDRRVPRLVAALRRGDAQVLGALLLMSQASRRDDARDSAEAAEFAVALAAEEEGIYGARMAGAGYGGRILYVGRPFLLPEFLDRAVAAVAERSGHDPSSFLL